MRKNPLDPKQKQQKTKRKIPLLETRTLILLFVCVVLTYIMSGQRKTRRYYEEAKNLTYYGISPEQLPDGTYRGTSTTSYLQVVMDVTVENHTLTNIDIIEKKGSKGKKVDSIIDTMIKMNTPVVQAIQKEELASLVYISCVDDALYNGYKAFGKSNNLIPETSSITSQSNQ
ncbi:MAG: hypothetical protein MJ162_02700 [Treponema sp.]|nr:hypothetical protein [Treponema sp.]